MFPGGWGAAPAGRQTAAGSAGSSRPPGCCTTWPCPNTPGRAAGFPASSDPWPAQMHSRTQVAGIDKFHGFMIMYSLRGFIPSTNKDNRLSSFQYVSTYFFFIKGDAWVFPEHSLISHEHLPKNETPITHFLLHTEKQPVCNFGPILDPWLTAEPTREADLIKGHSALPGWPYIYSVWSLRSHGCVITSACLEDTSLLFCPESLKLENW